MDDSDLLFFHRVRSKSFNVLIALSGWPDAKQIATYSARYVVNQIGAEKIGEINSKVFYDFSIARPLVNVERGLMKEYVFPSNELFFWKDERSTTDLFILIGEEPHLHWHRYLKALLGVLSCGKIQRIYLLGGLVDRIPHTVDPLITGVATDPEILEELQKNHIEPTNYKGPSSIHSLILRECGRSGIPTLSMWGHAPSYIKDIDLTTSYHLLSKVKRMIDLPVDLRKLHKLGLQLQKKLNELMHENPEFAEAVAQLEIEYKNMRRKHHYIT